MYNLPKFFNYSLIIMAIGALFTFTYDIVNSLLYNSVFIIVTLTLIYKMVSEYVVYTKGRKK